jgi:LuxR family maltose regulon positive regulatory protein
LASLREMVERSGADTYLIQIQLLDTLLHAVVGDIDHALSMLQEALALGRMHGFQRIFLDERDVLEPLLRKLKQRHPDQQNGYLDHLILSCQMDDADQARLIQRPSGLMIEPLSAREIEVLGYLSTHLTSNEIADKLCIAVSTVRSHIKNIYTKLNVHSRREAVTRAQELDLL